MIGGAIITTNLLPNTLGEFKQEIMKECNRVYQMIFKVGVTGQQVTVIDDKIVIIAKHKRIPILEIIDASNESFAEVIDRILIEKYKEMLGKNLAERFGLKINLILKDYDPSKEISGTLIILEQKIENYGW